MRSTPLPPIGDRHADEGADRHGSGHTIRTGVEARRDAERDEGTQQREQLVLHVHTHPRLRRTKFAPLPRLHGRLDPGARARASPRLTLRAREQAPTWLPHRHLTAPGVTLDLVARVTKTGRWNVTLPRRELDELIRKVASQHGLTVSPAGSGLELAGGSQARMRLKGAWASRDADLPSKGRITVSEKPGGRLSVGLSMEDSMGFGLMDRKTREKYERVLQSLVAAFGADLESASNASGTGDVVEELERIADLHARGVLSDSEFRAAKAKLLR